jgi:HAD superfamily hydrolase (TIGR01509 family)
MMAREARLKRIVWDFDGTLVDSRPLIVAGMEHALGKLGMTESPGIREAWLSNVGLPVEKGLENTFLPLGLDPVEVLKVYRTFDWTGKEHLLQPFPGMKELVAELHALGTPQAIATSKRALPLLRQLKGIGWEGCFNPIVTPDDLSYGKPHPESLLRIMATTGEAPEDLIMVGDTPFDLDMARDAGVPAVGVGHGFYPAEALLACQPRAYAPDVEALRDILLAWSCT